MISSIFRCNNFIKFILSLGVLYFALAFINLDLSFVDWGEKTKNGLLIAIAIFSYVYFLETITTLKYENFTPKTKIPIFVAMGSVILLYVVYALLIGLHNENFNLTEIPLYNFWFCTIGNFFVFSIYLNGIILYADHLDSKKKSHDIKDFANNYFKRFTNKIYFTINFILVNLPFILTTFIISNYTKDFHFKMATIGFFIIVYGIFFLVYYRYYIGETIKYTLHEDSLDKLNNYLSETKKMSWYLFFVFSIFLMSAFYYMGIELMLDEENGLIYRLIFLIIPLVVRVVLFIASIDLEEPLEKRIKRIKKGEKKNES